MFATAPEPGLSAPDAQCGDAGLTHSDDAMMERHPIVDRAEWLTRFERKFMPEPNSGCWLWFGATSSHGYGNFNGRRTMKAPRISWQLYKDEPLPEFVCHRCDFPPCLNPDHLFAGTPAINTRDCIAKGRLRRGVGVAYPNAKLTDDLARAILADPRPQRAIAAAYSISPGVVGLIKIGRRWRHATGVLPHAN